MDMDSNRWRLQDKGENSTVLWDNVPTDDEMNAVENHLYKHGHETVRHMGMFTGDEYKQKELAINGSTRISYIMAGAPIGNKNAAKDHVKEEPSKTEINPADAATFEKLKAMPINDHLKGMVDDLRKQSPNGQIEFQNGQMDPRVLILAAAGGQPLKDASAFLAGKLPVTEKPAPEWAKPFVEGGYNPGCCYDTAGRFVAGIFSYGNEIKDNVKLVHGFIGNKETTAGFGHAWVEINNDTVFDGVNQKFYDKGDYYNKLGTVPEQTYTPTEACKQMLSKKFYGPWGKTLGVTNELTKRKRK
jgi:hypothetical protein